MGNQAAERELAIHGLEALAREVGPIKVTLLVGGKGWRAGILAADQVKRYKSDYTSATGVTAESALSCALSVDGRSIRRRHADLKRAGELEAEAAKLRGKHH